jgi:hypothetical protein
MHPTNHDDDATEDHYEAASRVLGVQTEEVDDPTSDHLALRRLMQSWGYDVSDATDEVETIYLGTDDGVASVETVNVTNVPRSS